MTTPGTISLIRRARSPTSISINSPGTRFTRWTRPIKRIEKEGAKGLILDVRFNPGGYLDVARDICDLFIDDGLIVTIKPRVGEEYAMMGHTTGSIHRQRGKPTTRSTATPSSRWSV